MAKYSSKRHFDKDSRILKKIVYIPTSFSSGRFSVFLVSSLQVTILPPSIIQSLSFDEYPIEDYTSLLHCLITVIV